MRVGIDIGGTFTDIVCIADDGALTVRKVSSTVEDYSRSIIETLPSIFEMRGIVGSGVRKIIHGTTIATNALLEGRGARTGLLTTKGFRDVLELRRIRMPELYNWDWDKPPALIERQMRLEVDERLDPRGNVLKQLDLKEAACAVDKLAAMGVESIAVCLINSYVNPIHEQAIANQVRERHPNIPVSISAEILREIKEYERTATTVVNAYLVPVVKAYLESLETSLDRIGVHSPLLIMQSNGGVMTAGESMRKPVFIIESGPAAGVIASHALAQSEGIPNALTLDMGGTTTKASLIEGGKITRAAEYEVGAAVSLVSRLIKGGGHLIRVPVIDVAEIGAGGGSIAWLDAGGALRIGPRSAGSTPGPVCYGKGGAAVTITDANLVLGYLNDEGLAGGELKVNREMAEEAIQTKIAGPLEMKRLEAAYGVHVLACSSMMRALRSVSTERGSDVREFTLIAFGGSGPMHACEVASALDIKEVLIPPHAGLFSAFGLLCADVEHHRVQTYYKKTRESDLTDVNNIFLLMEQEVTEIIHSEGYPPNTITIERYADLRYAGQSYELTIQVPGKPLTWSSVTEMEQRFADEHERAYGHRGGEGEHCVFVSFRIIGRVSQSSPAVRFSEAAFKPKSKTRKAYFGNHHGLLETPIFDRVGLATQPKRGPLLIDEYDSTTVVPPGCSARLDQSGNIRIRIGGQA